MPTKTPDLATADTPVLRVALCQALTRQWDLDGNTARVLDAIAEAAARGAELAITPECALHGYGFDGVDDLAASVREAAEPTDGPRLRAVRRAARDLGIEVVLGFAERGPGDALYNSAALIDRHGEIVFVYRKVHCRDFETAGRGGVFTPGDSFHVSERSYPGGAACRLGCMICFDREVVESTRCLRALGAELIACPLATDTTNLLAHADEADNEMVTRVRAAENEVVIVVVNHAGRFNGGSFAVGPGGERLHQMGPDPGVHVLDIPIGVVRRSLHANPLGWMGWGYRRPDVYAPYLSR
jgi:predicted amidohydrolase